MKNSLYVSKIIVLLCLILVLASACTTEQKERTYHVPDSNETCTQARFGYCGVYLSDCSNGLEYDCVTNVRSELK